MKVKFELNVEESKLCKEVIEKYFDRKFKTTNPAGQPVIVKEKIGTTEFCDSKDGIVCTTTYEPEFVTDMFKLLLQFESLINPIITPIKTAVLSFREKWRNDPSAQFVEAGFYYAIVLRDEPNVTIYCSDEDLYDRVRAAGKFNVLYIRDEIQKKDITVEALENIFG